MASQSPMADWINEVKPEDVTFLQTLQESANSVVFKVTVHGRVCVMKVYHDREPSEFDSPVFEVNLFVCESTAYRRLKANGLCERGVIPDFYGTIEKIQPALWPGLHMFCGDDLPPKAILIEYIPNMKPIDLSNFSKDYLVKFRQILDDIHQAGVLHADTKPRNMVISQGEQDRVLWIDFDSAQTFPQGSSLSERQEGWFREENEIVDYFIEALAQDFEEGRINRTFHYYYEYN
ncbi:hypothetical protein N7535_001881 [Penicillium sp. DV-2018c]|nr:hypothetical protein N7535_001881 [Penicillium sp. DV-2018c]